MSLFNTCPWGKLLVVISGFYKPGQLSAIIESSLIIPIIVD